MKTRRLLWAVAAVAALSTSWLLADPPLGPKPRSRPAQPAKVITPKPASPRTAGRTNDLPVLGHLETRDRQITIQAGPQGPLYTVKGRDGKVLYSRLTAPELQARAPELYELVKTGHASTSGRKKVVIDASVQRSIGTR